MLVQAVKGGDGTPPPANGMPVGLVTQLVHQELGNFSLSKDADYQDLGEELYETAIVEEVERPSEGAPVRVVSNKYNNDDINAMKEDKGSDADNSVNVSRRPALQIPGPSANGIEEAAKVEDGGEATGGARRRAMTTTAERMYSYPDGWPTPMEDAFFVYPDAALPKILASLRKQALGLKAQDDRMGLTRAPDEMHRSSKFEFFKKTPLESAIQTYGAYFMCLPTLIDRSGEGGGGKEKREFQRALGCLSRIQSLDETALSCTDEAMWRSLLIAAGRLGGSKTQAVSMAIFAKMKSCGISPNPITYVRTPMACTDGPELRIRCESR